MSRTLFWYILKDLLRIFLFSSGVLAGIMSFGGLLRPLTEHGLSMGQVAHMLTYFQPPMTAYSLPIAALFATTIVYGRLGDNEIVACRAAGISHLALAVPAFVLGLTVAILGLLMLSFIVPLFMLKAEKVIFSNVGQIVANEIERTHQLKMEQEGDSVTVFAQSAVIPPDPSRPNEQRVVLGSPMFVTYESSPDKSPDAIRTPKDFYVAKQATCFINQNEDTDEMSFTTVLQGGCKCPAISRHGGWRGYLGIRRQRRVAGAQNTKFMDIWRLKELLNDESSSKRVSRVLDNFIAGEQKDVFYKSINNQLTNEDSQARLAAHENNEDVEYIIVRGKAATSIDETKLIIGAATPDVTRPVRMFQEKDGQVLRTFKAQEIEISATPRRHRRDTCLDRIQQRGRASWRKQNRASKFARPFDTAMSDSIRELPKVRTAKYYIRNTRLYRPG